MTWIETARRVVQHHQALCVNLTTGEVTKENDPEATWLDAFSAGMLVQVHDALNDENRAKFEGMTLDRAIDVGWKLVSS